jgi:hypothetical protein
VMSRAISIARSSPLEALTACGADAMMKASLVSPQREALPARPGQ